MPGFILHANCLWFYSWINNPKRQSLASCYMFDSADLAGHWVQTPTLCWCSTSHRHSQLHQNQTSGQPRQAPTALSGQSKNLLEMVKKKKNCHQISFFQTQNHIQIGFRSHLHRPILCQTSNKWSLVTISGYTEKANSWAAIYKHRSHPMFSIPRCLKTVTACLSGISAVVDVLKPQDTPVLVFTCSSFKVRKPRNRNKEDNKLLGLEKMLSH